MAEEEKAVEEKTLLENIAAMKVRIKELEEENTKLQGKLKEYATELKKAKEETDEW